MSFFNGLAGNIKGFATSTAKQAGSNLISNILSRASASMSGGAGASYGGLPPELANAKTILEMAMRIRYAQGWQWNIEIDGFSRVDMYVKDITYSTGNVETESKLIGGNEFVKPTHVTAGSVSMTVRDNEDGELLQKFKERRARIHNGDGTFNLPPAYLLNIRIYRVSQDGRATLEDEMKGFITTIGEISRARDAVGEFATIPVTFVKYTSAGSLANGLLKGVTGGITNQVQSSASNLIKF
ncbi:phage tail protein [Pantoea agglomerans]|uniref:phage tail protein n=1 Tax=Enterobacter agglomerans TaxID=549 RepID=UPI0035258D34